MIFDLNLISDPSIRGEYEHLLRRANAIAQSVYKHYGKGRLPIVTQFVNDGTFNAYAGKTAESYLIEINSAVPLFSMMLFARLFSDPSFFPEVPHEGNLESDFALPAVIDLHDFDQRAEWRVTLNGIRAFAAHSLADICSTFVICHEFGHILCGHVEAIEHYEDQRRVAELISISKRSTGIADRRQAWECDADSVAASLFAQFVEGLLADLDINERTKAVFGDGERLS